MSIAPLVVFAETASETAAHEGGINPWLVGAIVLALFVAMAGGLVAFGAGRDHA